MNLEFLCEKVCELTKEVGEFIRNENSKISSEDIETKGKNDFVTYVDKTSELKLIEGLNVLLPSSGYIVEENTIKYEEKEYVWIIDPLDGTTNFIHSIPCYSISIALMHNKEIVLGVVYEINRKECFYAVKDKGTFLNGKKVNVSMSKLLKDSLLVTGFPYHNYERLDKYLELFSYVLKNTHGLRRLGSAAVDLAYVACGRFETFFEYGLSPWDVAAGSLLVKEAGGKVSDFSGGENYIFGKEIIASNNLVFDEFLDITNKIFYNK